MENDVILSLQDISFGYSNQTVLENVNLDIKTGEFIGIVGLNGSGKSTLLKLILGVNKPTNGKIIKNDNVTVGYVNQTTITEEGGFPATIFEVVSLGLKKKPFSRLTKADKELAMNNIEKLGIQSFVKKSFRELSGGQQQRVLLARALCAASDMLVMDEPVTGLDPTVTDELYTIIRNLNAVDKLTIIMVSHDIHRAVSQSSLILHMNKEQLFFGTSKDYMKTEYYKQMQNVETCSNHCQCDCDETCKASHIIMNHHHHKSQ